MATLTSDPLDVLFMARLHPRKRVMDFARDCSPRVDAKGEGTLEWARARARSIERDEARLPLVITRGKAQPQRDQG